MDQDKQQALIGYLSEGKYPTLFDESEKRLLRKQAVHFFLTDNQILYRFKKNCKGSEFKSIEQKQNEAQLVVSNECEKQKILESLHAGLGGGHFGIMKTRE